MLKDTRKMKKKALEGNNNNVTEEDDGEVEEETQKEKNNEQVQHPTQSVSHSLTLTYLFISHMYSVTSIP